MSISNCFFFIFYVTFNPFRESKLISIELIYLFICPLPPVINYNLYNKIYLIAATPTQSNMEECIVYSTTWAYSSVAKSFPVIKYINT